VAVDLDRTLVYSPNSCGIVSDPLVIAEDHDGVPASFMTARAAELLNELASVSELVVVTTRSTKQVRRILLPSRVRHVLCTNGGVLLTDGVPDPHHKAWSAERLVSAAPLEEAWALMDAVEDRPWVNLVRSVEGLFCYLSATKLDLIPGSWLRSTRAWADENGYAFSVQGRKVYLVPKGLTKGAALEAFRARSSRPVALFAAGDSRLDAEMLNLADASVRPPHGELSHDPSLAPDAVEVSPSGVLAGEAVVEHLLALVRSLS
jgi:hydroxymethylpyrimidine pyrophosphatase-like HAD family hydrolase